MLFLLTMKASNLLAFATLKVLVLFGHVTPSHALAILTNLPGTSSGSGTSLGLSFNGDRTKAVGITVGATPLSFDSLEALISNTTPSSVLSGGIFSDSSGNPGSLLSAFGNLPIAENFVSQTVSLTSAPFTLQANTSYWFVLDGPSTVNNLQWDSLNPNIEPTVNSLITYNGYLSSVGGSSWGGSAIYNGLQINATPVPGPLPVLGIAAAFRYSRKLRRRVGDSQKFPTSLPL
ncbi:MAG: choice-of-anchor R domain-containing protein [Cyanobacteriota bacterium]